MKGIFLAGILLFGVATATAQTDLEKCSQMLGKALDEVSTCRDRVTQQENLISVLTKQNDLLLELLTATKAREAAKDVKITALETQVKTLQEIKCNESEWYFKPLGWKIFGGKKKDCYK